MGIIRRLQHKLKPPIEWNLNIESMKWLNKYMKKYLKGADRYVDLTYHKYKYHKMEYTQRDIIERIIYLTDEIIKEDSLINELQTVEYVNEVFDLYHKVYFAMWW